MISDGLGRVGIAGKRHQGAILSVDTDYACSVIGSVGKDGMLSMSRLRLQRFAGKHSKSTALTFGQAYMAESTRLPLGGVARTMAVHPLATLRCDNANI